jgi:hypothetical protein
MMMSCQVNPINLLLAKSILKHRISHSIKEELENKEYDEKSGFHDSALLCEGRVEAYKEVLDWIDEIIGVVIDGREGEVIKNFNKSSSGS